MTIEIHPQKIQSPSNRSLHFVLPPDKSVLHRVLFIGSLTKTAFTIPITSPQTISHDIVASVLALESLGVPIEIFNSQIDLQGVGRLGFRAPTHLINCANSGTTARLLMGLLAGQSFDSALTGDNSLSKRPMKRLADQLHKLGAEIVTTSDGTLPLTIRGRPLHGGDVRLQVASAQMKTALLLAGLLSDGSTRLTEPWQSRDHTERMLEAFGFGLETEEQVIMLDPNVQSSIPDEIRFEPPGDISSAAFLVVAAVLLKRDIVLTDVLLNSTRTRFLDIFAIAGVDLESTNITESWGEERGDLTVKGSLSNSIRPFEIDAADVPLLIDELPILFILAAFADGESIVKGAKELRLKESDRLHSIAQQLLNFGVAVTEFEDGMSIHGVPQRRLCLAPIQHQGDHRLAMAFSIAALFCDECSIVEQAEAVSVSYPDFFKHLSALAGGEAIIDLTYSHE